MRTFGRLAGIPLFLVSLAGVSEAACSGRQSRFYFHSPGPYKTHYDISGGTSHCTVNYYAGGTSTFHGMKVLEPPTHGKLGPSGEYSTVSFRYNVKSGFKGSDRFTVQVCGENRLGKGCARLEYTIEVK